MSSKARELLKTHGSYANQEKFEFLPGHKKLILGLRNRVKDFIDSNSKPSSKPKDLVETSTKKTVETSNNTTETESISESVELLSEEELENLKKELVARLNRTAKSNTGILFTENNIIGTVDAYISTNSRVTATRIASYKCVVKCTHCDKTVPCTFNKRWETSNLEAHLQKHTSTQEELNVVLGIN